MKVTIEGPIYDLTPLQPKDEESNKPLTWVRIFTKRHPEEVVWTVWVGDLVSRKEAKHLLIPDKDLWKFLPHRDMFEFKQQNGMLSMFVNQRSLSKESKKELQELFPNQIIVAKSKRKKGKEGSVVTFGGTTWEKLPISTAILNEEYIEWEKRHDLMIVKAKAEKELATTNAELVALGNTEK
ncbi:hypothetical protein LCGC14_0541360 [marine sediment metagenome]|uniref:Uncharacterized protein n=1 Tax=marine sediment metagenome TaxID=412755 RepID=A0A0F9SB76_9ZZZZ